MMKLLIAALVFTCQSHLPLTAGMPEFRVLRPLPRVIEKKTSEYIFKPFEAILDPLEQELDATQFEPPEPICQKINR